MANWSAHIKRTLSFNCNNTTQDNTKARKTPFKKGKFVQARKGVRCVLMSRKARRYAGT